MRVTQSMLSRTVVSQVNMASARIRRLHEMIATGRRVLRPSDDPAGTRTILSDRGRLQAIENYQTSISHGRADLNIMDGALSSAEELVNRAHELTLEGLNGGTSLEQRHTLAQEVRSLKASLLVVANSSNGGRFMFGGGHSTSAPFVDVGGHVQYRGNDAGRSIAADDIESVGVTLSGRAVFSVHPAIIDSAVDLNPAISAATPLADLHAGLGAITGSIEVTDSNGTTAVVDLGSAFSVGDVLAALNSAPVSITAAIRADGSGIEITDLGGGTTITVAEVSGGVAASQLGIAGSAAGSIEGTDLDPELSLWNPLALLNGGAGIPPGEILVTNSTGSDVRTARLDLGAAGTVAELMHAIRHASSDQGPGLGLDMQVSASGRSLEISSTLPSSTLELRDGPGGRLLSGMGLSGKADAQDLFNLMDNLAEELDRGVGDPDGTLSRLLARLDVALERVLSTRGEVGVRTQHLDRVATRLDTEQVEVNGLLDSVEGADLATAITDLTLAETQYQATLASGARLIKQSLLDYLG